MSALEGYKQSGEESCWLNRNYPELSRNYKALKKMKQIEDREGLMLWERAKILGTLHMTLVFQLLNYLCKTNELFIFVPQSVHRCLR